MPRLTCPNCETNFETAGARYTACPACGSRLDTRGPDGLRAVSGPSRTSETTGGRSPFDAADDLGDLPKTPAKQANRNRTVIIRTGSNTDSAPKALLAILVGTTVLGCLLVGVIVTLVWYLGQRPQVSLNAPSKSPSQSPNFDGSQGIAPGSQSGGPPPTFGPGIFAGTGPRSTAVPTPRGNLPGIDPSEFPQAGTEIGGGVQDILDLFPPGFFGPDGPGGGLGGGGFPGGTGGPPEPTGPGPIQPNPPVGAVSVSLSNLRIDKTRVELDFDYGNGFGLPFDRYVLRTSTASYEIRPLGVARGRGTITAVLAGLPAGPVEIWLERRTSPQGGQVQRISNILSR